MKFLLSDLGQCIVFGIVFIFLISGFYKILSVVTGG